MANYIRKLTTYTYIPGSIGTVSSPGTVEQPAYCTWVSGLSGWQAIIDEGGVVRLVYVEGQDIQVCYDAQPATEPVAGPAPPPSQTIIDNNIGWNAGAESVVTFETGTVFSFEPTEYSSGIIVGITDLAKVPGYSYEGIEFAFIFDNGLYAVMENGELKNNKLSFNNGDSFNISLFGSEVSYQRNGVTVYKSQQPADSVTYKADISMYAAGDQLNNAALSEAQYSTIRSGMKTTSAAMELLTGTINSKCAVGASAISADTNLIASAASMASTATPEQGFSFSTTTSSTAMLSTGSGDTVYQTSDINLHPMDGLASDYGYAESDVSFEPMGTELYASQYTPAYAVSQTSFAPMIGTGLSLTGQTTLSSDMTMEPVDSISSDYAYAEAEVSMLPLEADAYTYDALDGFIGFSESMSVTAHGYSAPGSEASLVAPAMQLMVDGGDKVEISSPSMQLTVSGVIDSVGRALLEAPKLFTQVVGVTGAIGSAQLTSPFPRITARAGSGGKISVPKVSVDASGTTDEIGRAQVKVPKISLLASSIEEATGSVMITAPKLFMMYGKAQILTPTLQLTITAEEAAALIREVLAINLQHSAVMPYSDFDAVFVGTFAGTNIMINTSGINEITGDTDGGEKINSFIEFASSDFGSAVQKRLPVVYIAGNGDYELDVSSRTGAEGESQNYSDNKYHKGADTRRVKLGRGTKGRYWGIRVESVHGSKIDIRTVEYMVDNLTRRRGQ